MASVFSTLVAFLICLSIVCTPGCREKAEKVKSEKEEVKQKQETADLLEKKKTDDAMQLFNEATKSWNALKLQEAIDLFDKAEKLDKTIEFQVKLRLNALSEKLVDMCKAGIESDGPDTYRKYRKNPQSDPMYLSKNCLDFIIGEDRIKEVIRTRAEQVRELWKRVNFARETYLKAERLINEYKRVDGVNLLKELSKGYRDSKWGLAQAIGLSSLARIDKHMTSRTGFGNQQGILDAVFGTIFK